MWQYQYTDELYHHGIIGMRWGYRKARPTVNRYESKDSSRAKKIKKKKLYQMSNNELRTLTNRQNLEKNYKQLNPSTIKKGIIAVGAIGAALGAISTLTKNSQSLIKLGKDAVYNARYKQLSLFK